MLQPRQNVAGIVQQVHLDGKVDVSLGGFPVDAQKQGAKYWRGIHLALAARISTNRIHMFLESRSAFYDRNMNCSCHIGILAKPGLSTNLLLAHVSSRFFMSEEKLWHAALQDLDTVPWAFVGCSSLFVPLLRALSHPWKLYLLGFVREIGC